MIASVSQCLAVPKAVQHGRNTTVWNWKSRTCFNSFFFMVVAGLCESLSFRPCDNILSLWHSCH